MVEVHGCGTQANRAENEGTVCNLECRIIANGNPVTIDSYQWLFQRRNTEGFNPLSSTEFLRLDDISYQDAGTYKCIATNAGGYGIAEDEILVNCKSYTF